MLDRIARRERTKYPPTEQGNLLAGIAEVLERRAGKEVDPFSGYSSRYELGQDDQLLALEIFWDLILDRIITPGLDLINPLPRFRVHSEAKDF